MYLLTHKRSFCFNYFKKREILCTLSTEISAPRKTNRPGAGSISFTMDFLPTSLPSAYDFNKKIEECLTLLEILYRDSYCIDFDTLCIEMNQYVFDIRCQLTVLDYDGGLWDCSTLAVTTALIALRRNDVTYSSVAKKLTSYSSFDRAQIPLTMYYKPATITFGFVDGMENYPIVDPTTEESVLINGYLVLGANHRDEICLIFQSGNLEIEPSTMLECSNLVLKRVKDLTRIMENSIVETISPGNHHDEIECI